MGLKLSQSQDSFYLHTLAPPFTMAALLRTAATLAKGCKVRSLPLVSCARPARCFASVSAPRRGHNLEDHYDMAEFVCKMHSPLGEYLMWSVIGMVGLVVAAPLMHSNYYFTGRFMPKDQGNTMLCDD